MSESNLTHSDFKLDNIKTLYKCQLCNELNNGKINDLTSVCNKCNEEFEIELKNIFKGLQTKYFLQSFSSIFLFSFSLPIL